MSEFLIEPKRADFEEVYFGNDQLHYTKSPKIKDKFRGVFISTLFVLVWISYTISTGKEGNYAFLIIIYLVVLATYLEVFFKLRKMRKSVQKYIDTILSFKENKITVTADYFSLKRDEEETIEKWENFKNFKIFEKFILFRTDVNYCIPINSFLEGESQEFIDAMKENIENYQSS